MRFPCTMYRRQKSFSLNLLPICPLSRRGLCEDNTLRQTDVAFEPGLDITDQQQNSKNTYRAGRTISLHSSFSFTGGVLNPRYGYHLLRTTPGSYSYPISNTNKQR